MDALTLNDLTFTYPACAAPAINNIDLRVKEGEFVLLCGSIRSIGICYRNRSDPIDTPDIRHAGRYDHKIRSVIMSRSFHESSCLLSGYDNIHPVTFGKDPAKRCCKSRIIVNDKYAPDILTCCAVLSFAAPHLFDHLSEFFDIDRARTPRKRRCHRAGIFDRPPVLIITDEYHLIIILFFLFAELLEIFRKCSVCCDTGRKIQDIKCSGSTCRNAVKCSRIRRKLIPH